MHSCCGTNYTDVILEGGDEVSMHELKKVVKQAYRVRKCGEKAPLIVQVVNKGGSWPRLWDSGQHGIQMGSRPSQGCWHIMVMDQSRVLCVTRTTLIPTPLDTF